MPKLNRYQICQLVGWSAYSVSGIILGGLFQKFVLSQAAATILHCFIGLWVSHWYRNYIRHHNWVKLPLKQLVAAVVTASVLLSLAWMLAALPPTLLIFKEARKAPTAYPIWGIAAVIWFNWSAVLFIWSLIYFGVHFFENFRLAEIERWKFEAAAKEAELRALKSQMSPHFIFNSLNSLRALVVEDPKSAQDAITKLANMLRYSLQSGQKETVSLQDEIRMVTDYLALEAIRFEERLVVRIEIAPETVACQVPPMAIQTLVENAVKHGISKRKEGGRLTLTSRLEGSQVHIQVTNDGQLETGSNGTGLGLHNTRERLALLFGEQGSLCIFNRTGTEVVVELTVPANLSESKGKRS
ncbi:MAG: histidine kinase [Blastocatellia bacterium]|nr:histidine kinase [Blastocatellia bacterium]